MDRGQARIRRQQRDRGFCKRGRHQRCHRFAVAGRLLQDGTGGPTSSRRVRWTRSCWKKAANGHKQTSLRASMVCAQKWSSCVRFG